MSKKKRIVDEMEEDEPLYQPEEDDEDDYDKY